MENISNFSLKTRIPKIILTNEAKEAIKHLVKIAPEEAQWFHTLTPVVNGSKNEILLQLSTKLFIPKQTTSIAEVNTSSSMMIEFYNELKTIYSDQNSINQHLASMTCWCHSHHKMSVNPSQQDLNQFKSFITSSMDQNQKSWQLMLIFNRQDEYYSMLYDPHSGNVYEGVEIVIKDNYDFNYITHAAKTKFLQRQPSFKWVKSKTKAKPPPKHTVSTVRGFVDQEEEEEIDIGELLFLLNLPKNNKKPLSEYSKDMLDDTINALDGELYLKELNILYLVFTDQTKSLPSVWSPAKLEQNGYGFNKIAIELLNSFSKSCKTFANLEQDLVHAIEISNCSSLKKAKLYIKEQIS